MMAGTGGGASMSSKTLSSAPLEANDTGRTNQLFLGCSGLATPQADTKRRAAKSHKRVGRGDGGEDREDLVHGAARARRWQVRETMETLAEEPGACIEITWTDRGSITGVRGRGTRSPSSPRYLWVRPLEEQQPSSDEQGTGAQPQQRGADGDAAGLRKVFLLFLHLLFLQHRLPLTLGHVLCYRLLRVLGQLLLYFRHYFFLVLILRQSGGCEDQRDQHG